MRHCGASWTFIGLTILSLSLSACAHKAVDSCPPVRPYPPGLADRILTLPATDPVFQALADYDLLRAQAKACAGL